MFTRHHKSSKHHPPPPEVTSCHSILRSHDQIRKGLWYAFNSLSDSTGTSAVSRLKVFTSSIGRALGFDKSEELLANCDSQILNFDGYFDIIEENLLKTLDKSSDETLNLANSDMEQFHKICWTLFYNQHFSHPESKTYDVSEGNFYKIWMVFNLLVEDDDNDMPVLPPKIDREEVQVFVRAFAVSSGQTGVDLKIQDIANEEGLLTFMEFVDLFMHFFGQHVNDSVFSYAVDTVYETFIDDVLEKGMICKRGYQVKNWKDRWLVLKPKSLKYYTHSGEKDMKGCVIIHKDCKVEVVTEKSGAKPNRFILHTNMKPYEMRASDLKTRNEWVTAFQIAIDNAEVPDFHYHKKLSKERQKKRHEIQKRVEEEERKRREDEITLQRLQEEYNERVREDERRYQEQLKELEAEKMAREDLEARFLKEAALHEVERRRLKELEAMKKELERLLEEERQAKRDEEIVRELQAKLLQEETEKRAELERLQSEQEEMLRQERQHREGLEGAKDEQERVLREAREKLEQLELDREAVNTKLLEASNKLQQAEKERVILQAKADLWKRPTIGLARPVQPTIDPHTTHRGLGAFCEADFQKHGKTDQQDSKHEESKIGQTETPENGLGKENGTNGDGENNHTSDSQEKEDDGLNRNENMSFEDKNKQKLNGGVKGSEVNSEDEEDEGVDVYENVSLKIVE